MHAAARQKELKLAAANIPVLLLEIFGISNKAFPAMDACKIRRRGSKAVLCNKAPLGA